MTHDMEAYRQFVLRFFNPSLESVRVKIVSAQYSPMGAADLAPYLSMVKFARPDVVIEYFSPEEHHITIFRQIMEISGWGDVNLVGTSLVLRGSTLKMPGTVVSYPSVSWAHGLPYPGAQKFEQDVLTKRSRLPSPTHVCLPAAMSTVELGGTDDPQAACSNKLEWESPTGTFVMGTDGKNSHTGAIFLFQGVNLPRSYLGASRLARQSKSSNCLTGKETEHGF